MNHLIWAVSLVGILSTAVICGTDMFFLTVGRPALRMASPSAGTEVMGCSSFYTIVCQSQSIDFKRKRQKREECSTMLESCKRRGIDR